MATHRSSSHGNPFFAVTPHASSFLLSAHGVAHRCFHILLLLMSLNFRESFFFFNFHRRAVHCPFKVHLYSCPQSPQLYNVTVHLHVSRRFAVVFLRKQPSPPHRRRPHPLRQVLPYRKLTVPFVLPSHSAGDRCAAAKNVMKVNMCKWYVSS
jgi:hypothetical protein